MLKTFIILITVTKISSLQFLITVCYSLLKFPPNLF